MKIPYWILLIVVLIVCFVWWQWPTNSIRMVMCDVGQGDAILFVQGFSQLLVDTGPPGGAVLSCLMKEMPFWDKHLEVMAISHQDSDHSGSLSQVESTYHIGQVMTTQAAKIPVQEMVRNGVKVASLWRGDRFTFGNLSGEVFWPPQGFVDGDTNRTSLVMRIETGTTSVWLAGDADNWVEKNILRESPLKPTTYLKVAHHGSKTATSAELLQSLLPREAWISVGKNTFGHPAKETLSRLSQNEIVVRRTDTQGSIQQRLSRN